MVGMKSAEISIGGVFLYARDPSALAEWYRRNLGIEAAYIEGERAYTCEFGDGSDRIVWAIMERKPETTMTGQVFMVNYRVANLAAVLERCATAGTAVEKTTDYSYGRFAWVRDPEGNQIELYETGAPGGTAP